MGQSLSRPEAFDDELRLPRALAAKRGAAPDGITSIGIRRVRVHDARDQEHMREHAVLEAQIEIAAILVHPRARRKAACALDRERRELGEDRCPLIAAL